MTLEELFKKWEGLDNPKESGVEFLQFVSDSDELDLRVITSLDEQPGDLTPSGLDDDDPDRKVGNYLLSFPYHARILIFDSVDAIDKELTVNNGKFKLPGYSYH